MTVIGKLCYLFLCFITNVKRECECEIILKKKRENRKVSTFGQHFEEPKKILLLYFFLFATFDR
jgi:hypothetical protein